MITTEKLNELMKQEKPFISYDENLAKDFLKIPFITQGNIPEYMIVDYFVDYILSQGLEEEVEL